MSNLTDAALDKELLRNTSKFLLNDFSLTKILEIGTIPYIKNHPDPKEGFSMDQCIMPPKAQQYLKCPHYDFF